MCGTSSWRIITVDQKNRYFDPFTYALSFVGLWTLARKYVEQWLFWMVVDVVCTILYIQKGIPFKALLYGLYVVIAIAGYMRWKSRAKIMKE